MKIVQFDKMICQLKFGLRDLIAIAGNLGVEEEDRDLMLLTLALGSPNVPKEEIEELSKKYKGDLHELMEEVLKDSLGGEIINLDSLDTLTEQVEELYKLAVGQLGVSPTIFLTLSPHEIELMYLGYLNDKELKANLFQKALKTDGAIELLTGEVGISTKEKRKETFADLGIEE